MTVILVMLISINDNDDAVVDDDADLCLHGCQWFLQHRAGSPQSDGWLKARQSDPARRVKVNKCGPGQNGKVTFQIWISKWLQTKTKIKYMKEAKLETNWPWTRAKFEP